MAKPPGKIVTFYSYKGGTGRSMILANVAYLLATDPMYGSNNRILMIDWDLEAPGLHRYFEDKRDRPSGTPLLGGISKRKEKQTGLIDYFEQVLKMYEEMAPSGGLPESAAHAELAASIYDRVRRDGLYEAHTHAVRDIPNLHLMRAGNSGGSDYPQQVRSFQWDEFYKRYGSFFPHFRDHLMDEYDYVLIDSRTGVTDTSGICTRVMPEKLVAVFAPNLQNIDGITDVIRRSEAHRTASRNPRSLQFFPVAARIDPANSDLRTLWWKGGSLNGEEFPGYEKVFEELFTELFELDDCKLHEYFDSTQIPHSSDYAYGEQIAARSRTGIHDRFSIGKACANLTERLVKLTTPWEPLQELKTELEEARRHAAEATQKAEDLQKVTARSGLVLSGVVGFGLLGAFGLVIALVPKVLSDSRFHTVGNTLAALTGAVVFALLGWRLITGVIRLPEWMYFSASGRRATFVSALYSAAVTLLSAGAVFVWWNSSWGPSKPASKAAVQLRSLLAMPDRAFAQVDQDKTITIHTSKAVQDSAGFLAAADSTYQNLLLLKSNNGNVPLFTFLSAYDLLPDSTQPAESVSGDLGTQFRNGIGEFRFGTKVDEVVLQLPRDSVSPNWDLIPVAGEYHNAQVRYLTIPLNQFIALSADMKKAPSSMQLPVPSPGSASLYGALPWFHSCWNGTSSITFFFTQSGGLIRISVRFFPDTCKDKTNLLVYFEDQFHIQSYGASAIQFQVTLPQTTVAATNGPGISSLEVFLTNLPKSELSLNDKRSMTRAANLPRSP
jgi:cellulose biosynthesis protein BcsQ